MNIYLLSRKVHRVLVLVISVSTLLMTITGLILKYPRISNVVPLDPITMRSLHNVASPYFGVLLSLMAITGLVMYFYPIYIKRKQQS